MLPQIHKLRSTLCLVRILITPNEEKTKFYSVRHKKAPRSTVAWLGRYHIIIPNSFCYFSLQSYRNPQGFLQLSRSHAIMLSPYAPLSLVCGYLALCFPGGKKYFCITLFILFTKKKKKSTFNFLYPLCVQPPLSSGFHDSTGELPGNWSKNSRFPGVIHSVYDFIKARKINNPSFKALPPPFCICSGIPCFPLPNHGDLSWK